MLALDLAQRSSYNLTNCRTEFVLENILDSKIDKKKLPQNTTRKVLVSEQKKEHKNKSGLLKIYPFLGTLLKKSECIIYNVIEKFSLTVFIQQKSIQYLMLVLKIHIIYRSEC